MRKPSDKQVVEATWCPRCEAQKGDNCRAYQMHRLRADIEVHQERRARYDRLKAKGLLIK